MEQSAKAANALPPPEVFKVKTLQVACDGSGEVSPALGHPHACSYAWNRTWASSSAAIATAVSSWRAVPPTNRPRPSGWREAPPRLYLLDDPSHRPAAFLYRDGALDPDEAKRLAARHLAHCDDGELYLQYSASEAFGFDDGRLKTADYNRVRFRTSRRCRRDDRLRPCQRDQRGGDRPRRGDAEATRSCEGSARTAPATHQPGDVHGGRSAFGHSVRREGGALPEDRRCRPARDPRVAQVAVSLAASWA